MRDLERLPTDELSHRAAEAGVQDPARDAYDRWAFVRELHLRPYSEPWRDWCVASNTLLRCLGADVLGQLGFNESHVRQRFRAYSDDSPRRSGLANVASCALIGLVLEPLILPINSPGHLGC